MHDPMTVAFEIRYPWHDKPTKTWPKGYRHSFITIWHKDPETDGTDDSCDWSGRKFPERQAAQLKDMVTNPNDNVQWFFEGTGFNEYDMKHAVFVIAANVRRIIAPRPWYRHPRWHVWHWHIQVHPVQHFKRWAFSRCAGCGKRFIWGYSPATYSWDGEGPQWFRSERSIYHHNCLP